MASTAHYAFTYTNLEDLSTCGSSQVHVFGVVKFCTAAKMATHGTDFCMTISIHNKALKTAGSRFTISLFGDKADELPNCEIGDIMRLNFVKLEHFRNKAVGKLQMHIKGSWMLFNSVNTTFKCDSSFPSPQHNLTDEEKQLVAGLQTWREELKASNDVTCITKAQDTPNTSNSNKACYTLSSIKVGNWINIRAQVVAKGPLTKSNGISTCSVRIQDGTSPTLELNPRTDSSMERINEGCLPDKYTAVISAYGGQAEDISNCQLGQFYHFTNVHCALYKSVGKADLYLHERNSNYFIQLDEEQRGAIQDRIKHVLDDFSDKQPEAFTEQQNETELDCTKLQSSNGEEPKAATITPQCKLNCLMAHVWKDLRVVEFNCDLDTDDSLLCYLDTKLLVTDLPELSIVEIHNRMQSGAHWNAPFICKTTGDILPNFNTSEPCDQTRVLLYISLRDIETKTASVTAILSAAELQRMCKISGMVRNHLKVLTNLLPVCELNKEKTKLTVEYVNRATMAVQIYKNSLYISHTVLV